jgi:hypothetical protein
MCCERKTQAKLEGVRGRSRVERMECSTRRLYLLVVPGTVVGSGCDPPEIHVVWYSTVVLPATVSLSSRENTTVQYYGTPLSLSNRIVESSLSSTRVVAFFSARPYGTYSTRARRVALLRTVLVYLLVLLRARGPRSVHYAAHYVCAKHRIIKVAFDSLYQFIFYNFTSFATYVFIKLAINVSLNYHSNQPKSKKTYYI